MTRRGVLAAGIASVTVGELILRSQPAHAQTASAATADAQAAPSAQGWKHAAGAQRGSDIAVKAGRSQEGRFGVMFKKEAAYAPPDDLLTSLAAQMTEPSGGTPTALDNPSVMAGYTFLGQFIDHDMTLDRTPIPQQQADPSALTNFDTPLFDLGSIYGRGPATDRQLYEPDGSGRLKVVRNSYGVDDLPRNGDGTAIIGDHRNDENLIVAQLHLLFLKFHNRCLTTGLAKNFAEAQRLTRWHFQWVIVHDFLRQLVGADVVADFIGTKAKPALKRQFYKPKNPHRPMMPIEYSVAAYRFGHSMVRARYVMNVRNGQPTVPPIFGSAGSDLRGSQPLPAGLQIEWQRFYPMPTTPTTGANQARLIDTKLALPLRDLPIPVVAANDAMKSLAERNLIRGKRLGLPSGQAVARAMGIPPLSNAELGLYNPTDARWGGEAPLWFYILGEAHRKQAGKRLGPVGGRIVAEVILGIMDADKNSYFHAGQFQPTAPIARQAGRFYMGDLVAFAQGT